MAKNKERDQGKRRQKAALKSARRRANLAKQPKTKPLSNLGTDQLSDEEWVFWLAHGVNYILSDYDQGVWSPLFEGIYEGKTMTPEEIAGEVMGQYTGVKEWPATAKAALAWTVSDRTVVHIYYREALRRALSTGVEPEVAREQIRQPHNPVVWELFNFLQHKLLRRKA
jgi:hypothetical protein